MTVSVSVVVFMDMLVAVSVSVSVSVFVTRLGVFGFINSVYYLTSLSIVWPV